MQRVVRSTLAVLTLAGLAACGDKVTVPPQQVVTIPTATPVVRSVTVSPATASLAVGDKITLAASVNADAGITDRTVTWTSSNTAIATVDANGLVTAVAAGNATITAAAKADATVKGAALVTVAGTGGTQPAAVTISNVNTTRCDVFGGCTSVPANLGAVAGQIDVTLNVDPGSAKLLGVDLIMNCTGAGNSGTDSVVVSQNVATAAVAPEASDASAPVTLSFNTATFNALTGSTAFKNGACTLKARARTSAGTTTSTSQNITLANADVLVGTVTPTKTAFDNGGLLWNGGNVTITATPVFYTSGRTAATTAITFEGKTANLTNAAGAGVSATFTDSNMGGTAVSGDPLDIDAITDANAGATIAVTVVDASGQPFTNAACGVAALCTAQSVLAGAPAPVFPVAQPFRLDTQKPLAGTLAIRNNSAQSTSGNGYVTGTFSFKADSASGYCGPNSTGFTPANIGTAAPVCTAAFAANTDNGGVDKVTVTFQAGVTATTVSYSNLTSTSSLNETTATTGSTNSYTVRQITTDALGNADTTGKANSLVACTAFTNGVGCTGVATLSATQTFGVDKTAPSTFASTQTAGPANLQTFTVIGASNAPAYTTSGITDNLSGPSIDPNNGLPRALVAQTRLYSGLAPTGANLAAIEGVTFSNIAGATSPSAAPGLVSPCMIGRFNASAAAAGANALQAYDRSGNAIGWCTPVFFDLIGGVVPAAADVAAGSGSTTGGYYKTEIITIDQAGNQTAPFINTIVEDATNPSVTGVDLPGSIAGNSTVSIPGTGSDNVDLVASFATVGYTGAAMNLRYPYTAGPGTAFDNVLTRSATVSATISNFIRTLSAPTAGAPTSSLTAGNLAQTVQLTAVDEVNRTGGLAAPASLAPVSLGTQTTNTWSAAFNAGFTLASSNPTISNCPAPTGAQTTGCGAAGTTLAVNPLSTTFTATALGTSATFNNPFSVVTFWYQNAAGDWVQFASTSGAVVSDNGTNRSWAYSTTFDPGAAGVDGTNFTPANAGTITLNIRAIGINSSGDAVTTATSVLTITNP